MSKEHKTYVTPETDSFDNGEPLYAVETHILDVERVTLNQLRSRLIRDGRWELTWQFLGDNMIRFGALFVITGFAGCGLPNPPVDATPETIRNTALLVLLAGSFINDFKKPGRLLWESRMEAFKKTFPTENVNLIPERFHPRRVLTRN